VGWKKQHQSIHGEERLGGEKLYQMRGEVRRGGMAETESEEKGMMGKKNLFHKGKKYNLYRSMFLGVKGEDIIFSERNKSSTL